MIYGKSRNVVVIQNIDSGYVEQAILILKKDLKDEKSFYASEEGIVMEAQRIIDDYTNRLIPSSKESKISRITRFFLIGAVAIILTTLWFLK